MNYDYLLCAKNDKINQLDNKNCMLREIKNKIRLLIMLMVFPVLFFVMSGFVLSFERGLPTQNCLFGGHSISICIMDPTEHIQEWQSMFTILPVKDTVSVLFLLLVVIAVSILPFWSRYSILDTQHLYTRLLSKKKLYIPNPLEEAFSQGILNPKTF